MNVQGSSVIGKLGLNPNPIGTPDELRKKGIGLNEAGSCAPSAGTPGHQSGSRGCSQYPRCIFHLTRYGGFRDHGPRNCGYYLKTHEGDAKEDFAACYWFVSRMLDRMLAGRRDREAGKNGEIIDVIAQEGEEILQKYWTIKEGTEKSLSPTYVLHRAPIKVPRFPRPGEMPDEVSYELEIEKRRIERDSGNPDAATGLPSESDPPGPRLKK